jgi:hypothetical protein
MFQRRSIALALALGLGCATAPARPELRSGTPLVIASPPPATRPPSAKSSPNANLMLVNPLECGHLVTPSNDPFFVFLALLCIPVLAAVDLVALPILAANSGGGDAGALPPPAPAPSAPACSGDDPAATAADQLAHGIASAYGLVRAPALGPEAPGAVALRLSVETTSSSSRAGRWSGRARLVDPEGSTLWEADCDAEVPRSPAARTGNACDVARQDADVLATSCARRWLDALWPAVPATSRS